MAHDLVAIRADVTELMRRSAATVHVAAACAGGREHSKRLEAAERVLEDNGAPYLRDAQISMVCVVDNMVESGTRNVASVRTDSTSP